MHPSWIGRCRTALAATLLVAVAAVPAAAQTTGVRSATFLDVQGMRSVGSPTPSPDGRWLLYTVSTPDWEEAQSQTDLHLVSLESGLASSRQMTFTREASERSPQWARDGSFFVFVSNRDAPASSRSRNQLYLMRPDGGEARQITDHRTGVSDYAFTRDGAWLIFRSGGSDDRQLYRLPVTAITDGDLEPEQLTRTSAGVDQWSIAPNSQHVYFLTDDEVDEEEKQRQEKGYTVNIYHQDSPRASLWALDLGSVQSTRLTEDPTITVSGLTISDDSRWVGFRGTSADRFERTIQESGLHTELYLLDTNTGAVEQLTDAGEVNKSGPFFSPDGRWVAFTASRDMSGYNMLNRRVYLREVGAQGGEFRPFGNAFDGSIGVDFWSADGDTIYFNTGIRATRQLLALDLTTDEVRQLTDQEAALTVRRDDDSGVLLATYSDPVTPSTLYAVPSVAEVPNRSAWIQLTDANPQVGDFSLGRQEEVMWRSTDGHEVGGVLTLPVGYQEGQRYPLVVWIHGGPSAADVNGFNLGSQVYAGAGYVVLRPNYRGSTNYGEAFNQIAGDYFPQGYDDIMTGVDHLIAEGIVDGDRRGAMGWSAGGHWSNWILVNTDRFRAISSGAGTSNWISMYAQSDVQRNRQFYLGNELPYHNFDAYWDQSPLKYITNARTPTMIHVVEGDPRVPSPQSVELHMALKKLGVPTELFMYPGQSHGIPGPRNQYLKAVSEMAWMDYYVRGVGDNFSWRLVLDAFEPTAEETNGASN